MQAAVRPLHWRDRFYGLLDLRAFKTPFTDSEFRLPNTYTHSVGSEEIFSEVQTQRKLPRLSSLTRRSRVVKPLKSVPTSFQVVLYIAVRKEYIDRFPTDASDERASFLGARFAKNVSRTAR